jgi:LysR family hydrogen peroxide-inducible transcriptional activator
VQYVLALHRTGSFSEAAKACHITQSTLSTMIKKLEEQIDISLFDRKTKPIKLTVEGESLIDQFKVLYHEYDNLIEVIQETRTEYFGTFKIGIIPTLAPFLMPFILKNMIQSHPRVKFTIMEIPTEEILKLINLRELDVGLLSTPVVDNTLIQRPLFAEDFLIYDATSMKPNKRKYSVDDIDLSRLWLLEESHCMSFQIEKICHLKQSDDHKTNLIYKSGSILSLINLVEANKGLTLIPRIATLHEGILNPDYLHTIVSPSPAREIGTVTHPNFSKKQLLASLEEKVLTSVRPTLSKVNNLKIINPM